VERRGFLREVGMAASPGSELVEIYHGGRAGARRVSWIL